MKHSVLLCFAAILLLTSSCREENTPSPEGKTFVDGTYSDFFGYYDNLKKAKKSYHIQSFSGIYNTPLEDDSNIAATTVGNNQPPNLVVDGKNLSLSDFEYYPDDNQSVAYRYENMSDFYGKSYDLKFAQNAFMVMSGGSVADPLAQVHIPKLFFPVSYENLTDNGELTAGTVLKWNADEANENGVVIYIEYHPDTQSDSLNRINYPDRIRRGTKIEDDGQFVFKASDFVDFPNNADLDFELSREGFTTYLDENGNDCSFSALVIAIAGFRISIAE